MAARLLVPALAILAGVWLVSAGADEPEELNTRLQITVIESDPDAAGPTGEAKAAVRAGRALSCLVRVPEATTIGGPLLDPRSVEFSWNGAPLPTFAYYHHPVSGLAFVLLEEEVLRGEPEGELSLTARLLGEEEPAAGWRLPVDFTGVLEEIEGESRPTAPRAIAVRDEAGAPLEGAFLFGQGVQALFARTGPDGIVPLDNPRVDPASPHYAWAEGYWPTRISPLEQRRATLHTAGEETSRQVETTITDESGRAISPAIVDLEMGSYTVLEGDGPHLLAVPDGRAVRLVAVAAGYGARSVEVEAGEESVRFILQPLAPPLTDEAPE